MPKSKYKKRPDGRYRAQIDTGRLRPDGKPDVKYIYGRTQPELDDKVTDFKALLKKGIVIDDNKITFKQFAQIWLTTYKSDISSRTQGIYEAVLRLHCGLIDDMQLSKIRPDHVQNMINSLSETRRQQERALMITKAVFDRAIKNELVYKNPAADITLNKVIKVEKRALADEEIKDIECLLPKLSPIIQCYIAFMLYCGLRRGEAWSLTKGDINFERKTLNINKTAYIEKIKKNIESPDGAAKEQVDTQTDVKSIKYERIVKVGPPKTQAGIRQIPMPDKLVRIIRPYMEGNNQLLLFHKDGVIFTECQMNKLWTKFLKRYNRSNGGTYKIKAIATDITPHTLRHTYATSLYYAGVDIKTAQYLLGHNDIKTTLAIYTHLQKGKTVEAIQKLNDYLNSIGSEKGQVTKIVANITNIQKSE